MQKIIISLVIVVISVATVEFASKRTHAQTGPPIIYWLLACSAKLQAATDAGDVAAKCCGACNYDRAEANAQGWIYIYGHKNCVVFYNSGAAEGWVPVDTVTVDCPTIIQPPG